MENKLIFCLKNLKKKKFEKFREEELEHKDKAEQLGANNDGLYSLLDTVIKNSSKFAIAISKRY